VLGCLLFLCGCGARTSLEVGEQQDEGCVFKTITIQVPSTTAWFDTGLDVLPGQRLQITTTGTVHYGVSPEQVTDANGGTASGKKFFTTAVLPNTVVVSLIGKVGGSTAVDTGTPLLEGTPNEGTGFIGTSYDKLVPEGGRLFLGFNDQKQAFGDNSGSFTVTITLCV